MNQNWMKTIEAATAGNNLPPVPEEAATGPASPSHNIPDFKVPLELTQMARDSNEVYKLE